MVTLLVWAPAQDLMSLLDRAAVQILATLPARAAALVMSLLEPILSGGESDDDVILSSPSHRSGGPSGLDVPSWVAGVPEGL